MTTLGSLGIFRGIPTSDAAEVINFIKARVTADQARQVFDNMAKADASLYTENLITSDREKFATRVAQLPDEVMTRLTNGIEQAMDDEIYSVVPLGAAATNINDIFPIAGSLDLGLRNIANAKLDANRYFLLTAIELMYGIDEANSGGRAGSFTNSQYPSALFAGEIELKQNGRSIIRKQSLGMFFKGIQSTNSHLNVSSITNVYQGRAVHVLHNPKWIYPQQALKGVMEWAVAPGAVNSYLKIRLIGVSNERA